MKVMAAWKVGTPRGLDHEGKHLAFGAPFPRAERCANFKALVSLGWLLPNIQDSEETELASENAAHAKEEESTRKAASKPARVRRKALRVGGRKAAGQRRRTVETSAGASG